MAHAMLMGVIFLNLFAPLVNVAPVAPVLADSSQDWAGSSVLSSLFTQPTAPVSPATRTIHLKSRELQPSAPDLALLQRLARPEGGRVHVLIQLDFIPRQAAKDELKKRGVELLAYVPDYAWIASVPAANPASAMLLPGVA